MFALSYPNLLINPNNTTPLIMNKKINVFKNKFLFDVRYELKNKNVKKNKNTLSSKVDVVVKKNDRAINKQNNLLIFICLQIISKITYL